jgi:hypothetical protein
MLYIFRAVAFHIQVLFPTTAQSNFFTLVHVSATYCSHHQVANITKTLAAYCTLADGNIHKGLMCVNKTCMNIQMCFFIPEIKSFHKICDILLFGTASSYLCICTELHVSTSKNTIIFITGFIYVKTDLLKIITVFRNCRDMF